MNSWDKSAKLVAHLLTANPEYSRVFYRDTLEFTFSGEDDAALVFNCAGVMLRIGKVETFKPVPYTVLGWSVTDIEAAVRQLKEKGIGFKRYTGLDFDAQDICTFYNGDRVAWFNDPDGNLLSITQFAHE